MNRNTLSLLICMTGLVVLFGGCAQQPKSESTAPAPQTQPAPQATTPSATTAGNPSTSQPASAPATITPPATTVALATHEGEVTGLQVDLIEVKKTSGNTITIRFRYRNTGNKVLNLATDRYQYKNVSEEMYFVDATNNKKYFVVRDAEDKPLSNDLKYKKVEAGETAVGWAKFPAPPADVTKISIYVPWAPPFEDVPIS